MFGCLPLDAAPRRRSACRTADVLALKSHNLDATIFWFPRPKFRRPCPSGIANSARHPRSPKGRCGCWSTRSWSITYFILCSSSRDCLKTLRTSFNSARASRVYGRASAHFYCLEERRNRGHRHASDSAFFRAPPMTCRVCPRAFWRRRAGWTTSGRCYDDEFFRPSYSSQACQPAHALIQSQRVQSDPEPKGAPRSIRSASVPPMSDVATVEGVPDLATGKNRRVT